MNRTQLAATEIRQAIILLKTAKNNLLKTRNDQHMPLAMQLAALEEVYATLTDPECTPEIMEGRESELWGKQKDGSYSV